MNDCWLGFHTFDVEMAIDDLKEPHAQKSRSSRYIAATGGACCRSACAPAILQNGLREEHPKIHAELSFENTTAPILGWAAVFVDPVYTGVAMCHCKCEGVDA